MFAQEGAQIPPEAGWRSVRLAPVWAPDKPISIIRGLCLVARRSRSLDAILVNTYVTGFGRSAVANGIGLLLVSFLGAIKRRAVTVYMHNFLETQDIDQLGYNPSIMARLVVRLLEGLILRTTKVVVPLQSQEQKVRESLGGHPLWISVPYLEPYALALHSRAPIDPTGQPVTKPLTILLLGKWGPQKDLAGALAALKLARDSGGSFLVDIVGSFNRNFPDYEKTFREAIAGMNAEWVRVLEPIPEGELLKAVAAHEILLLPYNASGGYSAAMTIGAYCGLRIISYDLPQLRECARALRIEPIFVPGGSVESLSLAIQRALHDVGRQGLIRYGPSTAECDNLVNIGTTRLLEHALSR